MAGKNVRRLALRLFSAWEEGDRYINLVLDDPAVSALGEEDHAFLVALLFGTVERRLTLLYHIRCLARDGGRKMAPHTRRLLCLGLYQLLYMDGVPDYAAIAETVALAGSAGERGFVNAVLRNAVRFPERLALPAREDGVLSYLSLRYSFPEETVALFLAERGEEMTERLLASFCETQPLTISVNLCRTDRKTVLAALHAAGYAASETPYAPYGIRLAKSVDPTRLPGFREGWFFVQDEASQIACAALSPGMGRVVDTCAAPGGKSFGVAMTMREGGELFAMDLHESKLSLIRSGAERLGLSSVHTAAHDGSTPLAALCGTADGVICDAPCSGLGVLGKKADLRYRAGTRFAELPPLQEKILSSAAAYVRQGGELLYATCTIHRTENEEVAARFLAAHPDFAAADFAVGGLRSAGGMLQLLPPTHGTDGFFLAKFTRRRDEKESI